MWDMRVNFEVIRKLYINYYPRGLKFQLLQSSPRICVAGSQCEYGGHDNYMFNNFNIGCVSCGSSPMMKVEETARGSPNVAFH